MRPSILKRNIYSLVSFRNASHFTVVIVPEPFVINPAIQKKLELFYTSTTIKSSPRSQPSIRTLLRLLAKKHSEEQLGLDFKDFIKLVLTKNELKKINFNSLIIPRKFTFVN